MNFSEKYRGSVQAAREMARVTAESLGLIKRVLAPGEVVKPQRKIDDSTWDQFFGKFPVANYSRPEHIDADVWNALNPGMQRLLGVKVTA